MPPAGRRPPGPPNGPERAPVARCRALRSACRCASARRPATARSWPGRSGSGGGTSRFAMQQVAEQDDQRHDAGRDEQPDLRADPGPEHAVEADAAEPDRVGPQVDAGGRRTSSATIATMPMTSPARRMIEPNDGGPAPSSGPPTGRRAGPPGGGVPALRRRRRREVPMGVGSAGPAARPLRRPRPRRRAPRRRRRRPRSGSGSSSWSSGGPSPSPAGRFASSSGRRPSAWARRRSSSRMNSSKRSPIARSLGRIGRPRIRRAAGRPVRGGLGGIRAGPGPRRIARTPRARARRSGSGGGSRRGPAPSGTPRGRRGDSATGGRRRRVGRAG